MRRQDAPSIDSAVLGNNRKDFSSEYNKDEYV